MDNSCVQFVPFADYDWTFTRRGWLKWNPTAFCLIAAFCGIAYWMCIEMAVLAYVTFKRHSGLYFCSIVVTTVGIALQTTGYILKEFQNDSPPILTTIICKLGWICNVTGFSVVLWSRLHLVVRNPQILRLVLAMILIDGVVLHTPVVVFEFGLISRHHDTYVRPMEIMERLQQTIFTLQETIISSLYIYHTARFLNGGYASHTRKVMSLLVGVQALVIALDAGLTILDYMNMFTLKCTVHPFVYSVKLKLELIVLNQLLGLVNRGMTPGNKMSAMKIDSTTPPDIGIDQTVQKERSKKNIFAKSFHLSLTCGPHISKTHHVPSETKQALPTNLYSSDFQAQHRQSVTSEAITEPRVPRGFDTDMTLEGNEMDPNKAAGSCDDSSDNKKGIDDIERQYLGRFGM